MYQLQGSVLVSTAVIGATLPTPDLAAAPPMQVDELGDGQLAVAPARVRVKLAEERTEASSHCLQDVCALASRAEKSG